MGRIIWKSAGRALGREVKLARAQSVKSVRDEGYQTAPQIVVSSTPELRKRLRADHKPAGHCCQEVGDEKA